MAIHRTDDGYFVISSQQVWLPGCYEDERAARFAFRLPDAALQTLQDNAIARGNPIITWGDVAKAAEELRRRKRADGR